MKKLISAIAAVATAVVTITPAQAQQDHNVLLRALNQIGVTTVLNNPLWCKRGRDGMYDSGAALLVICQKNATGRAEVAWTENDLDTLRHEAHHVVQDCNSGTIGDARMSRMFTDNDQLAEFVKNAYTVEQAKRIMESYRLQGVTGESLLQEIEAFSVARTVGPETIAKKVLEFCSK